MPEVIFGQGKTPRQVADIFSRLAAHGCNVLATRATEEQYAAVAASVPRTEYRAPARAIVLKRDRQQPGKGVLLVATAGITHKPASAASGITAPMMGDNVTHV